MPFPCNGKIGSSFSVIFIYFLLNIVNLNIVNNLDGYLYTLILSLYIRQPDLQVASGFGAKLRITQQVEIYIQEKGYHDGYENHLMVLKETNKTNGFKLGAFDGER